MLLWITWSDGQYSYRPTDSKTPGCVVVEVPDSTVAVWDAICKLTQAMDDQLGELDTAWHAQPENHTCDRDTADIGQGRCIYCNRRMEDTVPP